MRQRPDSKSLSDSLESANIVCLYCVKCKTKTETNNIITVKTKNNRPMLTGTCVICGSKKCTFLSSKSGNGFLNNLPIELHLPASKGENVTNGSFNNLQKYSYCGPGTRYDKRVKEGFNIDIERFNIDSIRVWLIYRGINELDSMCKLHDQFYNKNSDTPSRNVSDIALAHRANEIANNDTFDAKQRRDAKFVAMIMKNKARFGLGLTPKNSKRGPA